MIKQGENVMRYKILTAAIFAISAGGVNAKTIWQDDFVSMDLYQVNGEFSYSYLGENFGADEIGVNDGSLLSPKTEGKSEYDLSMIGLSYSYYFNGNDFIKGRLGTNFSNDVTVQESNFLRNQTNPNAGLQEAFAFESNSNNARKNEFEFNFGTTAKSYNSHFDMFMGLFLHTKEFETKSVEVKKNTYDIPVYFNEGNYLETYALDYGINVGFDYKRKFSKNLFWNIGATFTPYMKHQTEIEYQNRQDPLQPYYVEMDGDGWGASLKTGLSYDITDNLQTTLFYRYYQNSIDGEADMKYKNLNNEQYSVNKDMEELENKYHSYGISLKYYY